MEPRLKLKYRILGPGVVDQGELAKGRELRHGYTPGLKITAKPRTGSRPKACVARRRVRGRRYNFGRASAPGRG